MDASFLASHLTAPSTDITKLCIFTVNGKHAKSANNHVPEIVLDKDGANAV